MPRLTLISPEFADQSCTLPNGTFTVGRSRKNHIIIREDSVSQVHCELLVYGTEVIVRERGSRNGTFVNGVRVKAQSGVRHGESLRFGNVEVRVEIERPDNHKPTEVTAFYDHQKVTRDMGQQDEPEQEFPVEFARVVSGSGDAHGVTLIVPAQPEPVVPADQPASPVVDVRMAFPWRGLVAGLIAAAGLLAYWLWKG